MAAVVLVALLVVVRSSNSRLAFIVFTTTRQPQG
jgi:hypothetical protein